MLKRILLTIFFCCLCFTSAMAQYAYIEDGIGIAGITVGKSKMLDVVTTYGEDYKLIEHSKASWEARFSNGLSFWYKYDDTDKKIFHLQIRPPYQGITTKGIVVGESTLKEVIEIYGEAEPFSTTANESWFYEYKGIEFHAAFESYEESRDLETFLQKKVIAIEVTTLH